MDKDVCPSCGKALRDHDGILLTCAALQAANAYIRELQQQNAKLAAEVDRLRVERGLAIASGQTAASANWRGVHWEQGNSNSSRAAGKE